MKNRRPSIAVVKEWISSWDGELTGKNYKPFLFVRDVPSEGKSAMFESATTGRVHHYFSALEDETHALCEHDPDTGDIREQFALLPHIATQQIASRIGVKHPVYPGTTTSVVLTTDILLSKKRKDGVEHFAISVKPEKELYDPKTGVRTLQKLLIERLYWSLKSIEWILVTDKTLPRTRAKNLLFFAPARTNELADNTLISLAEFAATFRNEWADKTTLISLVQNVALKLNIDAKAAHALLGRCVWDRSLLISLDEEIISHESYIKLI